MKILVLSLLRIGDIVLAAPVLRGLRERYPHADIHLMINSQFMQVAPLMPYVDRFIGFDRQAIQTGLGDGAIPLFESYERLNDVIDGLNGEKYDWAVNLTHNRLSAWVMGLINAKRREGLCFDSQARASFGSNWFRYLNHQVDLEGDEVFHYADVFRYALGLGEESVPRASFIETVVGRREAELFAADLGTNTIVAIQALTSDVKKDWGLGNFASAIASIQRTNPGAGFAILGAPSERARLAPLLEQLEAKGICFAPAILSFEGAFSLLKKAKLLVTGDTSIKHLASIARTPIVEISLGSSDFHRTGATLHGSLIVQTRESCAPCVHSKPCHRESHVCAKRVSSDVVAMVASEVLAGRSFQLAGIAEEYRAEVDILRVDAQSAGFWAAHSLLEPVTEEAIGRWLDLTCKKIWLESGSDRISDNMGTETLRLSRLLRAIHPEVSEVDWRHLFAEFERQAVAVEGRINSFKVGLQYLRGCYEDPRKLREFVRGLIALRERVRHAPLLKSFKNALDSVIEDDISPAFTRFRRISDLVVEIDRRTDIHLRLIRGLLQSTETEREIERT